MKKVDQTEFGGQEGNCWSACIASILELDIGALPNFMTRDDWLEATRNWLSRRGFTGIMFQKPNVYHPECYHIVSGKSPRGNFLHAVVGYKNKLVHDPHPDRTFIAGKIEDTFLIIPKSIIR